MDEVTWYTIDGNENRVRPWIVEPRRPMGCQYINTHNEALSRTLNCNTNVQIGDPSSIFYTTLYTTKDNKMKIVKHRNVFKIYAQDNCSKRRQRYLMVRVSLMRFKMGL